MPPENADDARTIARRGGVHGSLPSGGRHLFPVTGRGRNVTLGGPGPPARDIVFTTPGGDEILVEDLAWEDVFVGWYPG